MVITRLCMRTDTNRKQREHAHVSAAAKSHFKVVTMQARVTLG